MLKFEALNWNIYALRFVCFADLAFIDPADAFPLKNLCDFYRHPLSYCFEDQSLDELLDEFKKGKSHMSIVQAIRYCEDVDPTYSVVGIVTLEDVIEEILKIEIVDESDVLSTYFPHLSHFKTS